MKRYLVIAAIALSGCGSVGFDKPIEVWQQAGFVYPEPPEQTYQTCRAIESAYLDNDNTHGILANILTARSNVKNCMRMHGYKVADD